VRNGLREIATDGYRRQHPLTKLAQFDPGMKNSNKDQDDDKKVPKWNTSYLTQLYVLTHRSMRNSRSAIFTTMNFIKSAGLGLIGGICFYNLGTGEKYVADRSGFAFFAMTYWVFDSLFTALMSFPPEKKVSERSERRASNCWVETAPLLNRLLLTSP